MTRSSGIVLHISSLPNPYGIGTFGDSAYAFIDFLRQAGQRYWQILPLVPTGFGDSPYQSCSASAINPYFIELDYLRRDGLLEFDNFAYVNYGQDLDRVDYGTLYASRYHVLRMAYENSRDKMPEDLEAFKRENADWLPDYALFMAIKSHFGMVALSEWPDADIRARKPEALRKYAQMLSDDVAFQIFMQYKAFKQWGRLRNYAAENGVRIIGDMPIYCAEDSAEVWAQPELFKLEKDGTPKVVAGVPPDLYSSTGQLWGNPIYDWDYHKKTGYKWWIDRFRHATKFYDVLRIDHFRGLESYWEIPYGEKTAMNGEWIKGPAMDFINTVFSAVTDIDIIAEDLGELSEDVTIFLKKTGFPGMRLLVDAFDPYSESSFLPHNIDKNCVAYTSTHDSPTFIDFFYNIADHTKQDYAADYLRLNNGEGYNWGAVKAIWGSPSVLAMAPMADILGLGADARFNIPATLGGNNWQWRVRVDAFNASVANILNHITKVYWR
ncbi:MAG: 4-alpha-glucanotransferase [Oscillospiraceae bacterium]|nr:4-alpha-glucanotransferase [Oscillospiraceae bacterium]